MLRLDKEIKNDLPIVFFFVQKIWLITVKETAFKSKRRTQTLKQSLIPLFKKGIQNDKADYLSSPLSTTRLDEESYQIVNSRSNTMQKYFRAMVL